jgi:dihydroxyacid dehydratase/phosphogluconate dehydratase
LDSSTACRGFFAGDATAGLSASMSDAAICASGCDEICPFRETDKN